MKEEITLFLHVTDGGAIYYTDNHDFFEATVVIRVDGGLEILRFDTESKEYFADIDTEISRFPDGSVFVDGEGWKHSDQTEFDDESYRKWIQLKEILKEFNQSVEAGE